MLKKIISGCQTGADIAAIDAAIDNGFPYGGWVPKGRRTEAGPLPLTYAVREMDTRGYPKRTEQNILDADGTVICSHGRLSGGSVLTRRMSKRQNKPWLHLDLADLSADQAADKLVEWIDRHGIEVLNVAGQSASKNERIYAATFAVIDLLLRRHTTTNR
jgi:hypothetical protein